MPEHPKEHEKSAKEHRVAVFFDYENIVYSLRNRFQEKANFEALINKCKELGRIVEARVFADWGLSYMSPALMYALQSNGFDLIFVPTGSTQANAPRKNVVDLYMAINVMQVLHTREDIDTFVLLTGDRDFMPLVNHLKRSGKRTVAIGVDGSSSYYLTQAVDDFFYYSEVEQNFEEKPRRLKGRPTNIYDALVQAVQIMREKGRTPRLTNLKPVMIELLGGFDEKEFTDARGRNFRQFKDFVLEAESRGLVRILTRGNINEVILLTDSEEAIAAAAAIDDEPHAEPVTPVRTAVPASPPVGRAPSDEMISLQAAFKLLVQAVQSAQEEGRSFRASSIKHRILKLEPKFDEKNIHSGSGEPFSRFNDFLEVAADQGLVRLAGSGVKMEVLPVKDYSDEAAAPAPAVAAPDDAAPAADKGVAEQLTGDEARAAILAGLRAYSNYPTSFLSLASFVHRWLDGQNKLVDEQEARELMTEAVEIDLLQQTTKPDGRKQYELQATELLARKFLHDAAELPLAVLPDDFIDEEGFEEALGVAVTEQPPTPNDPFEALLVAVRSILSEGKDPVLPRVKSAVLKLMPNFDESKIDNPNGGRFSKFKDFVLEGERRRMVRLEVDGTVNRVFLPHPRTVEEEPAIVEATGPQTVAPQTVETQTVEPESAEIDDMQEAFEEAVAEALAQDVVVAAQTTPNGDQEQSDETPAYLEFQRLNESAQRQMIVEALRSYDDYPAAFMAILAHCRRVRDARQVFLPPNELRELLSDATRTPLVRPVSPRGERPTLYGFFDDAAAVEAYVAQAAAAPPSAEPVAEPAAEQPQTRPAEPAAPEPVVEKPALVVRPSVAAPSNVGVPLSMRAAIVNALRSYERYPAPFLTLLDYVTQHVEENAQGIEGDLRALLSEATRTGLLNITSARGSRPTLYALDSSDKTINLYMRTRAVQATPPAAAPEPAESTAPAAESVAQARDVFAVLREAIQTLKANDKSTIFSSVKRQMREIVPEFDESNYTDVDGNNYKRFKDLIEDAERRGHVVMTMAGKVLAVELLPAAAETLAEAVSADEGEAAPVAEAVTHKEAVVGEEPAAVEEPAAEEAAGPQIHGTATVDEIVVAPMPGVFAEDEVAAPAAFGDDAVGDEAIGDEAIGDDVAGDEERPLIEDETFEVSASAAEDGAAQAQEAVADAVADTEEGAAADVSQPAGEGVGDPLVEAFALARAAVQQAIEEKRSHRLSAISSRMRSIDPSFDLGNLADPDGQPFRSAGDFMRAAEEAGYVHLSGEGVDMQVHLP